jgi:hypothetical protein
VTLDDSDKALIILLLAATKLECKEYEECKTYYKNGLFLLRSFFPSFQPAKQSPQQSQPFISEEEQFQRYL